MLIKLIKMKPKEWEELLAKIIPTIKKMYYFNEKIDGSLVKDAIDFIRFLLRYVDITLEDKKTNKLMILMNSIFEIGEESVLSKEYKNEAKKYAQMFTTLEGCEMYIMSNYILMVLTKFYIEEPDSLRFYAEFNISCARNREKSIVGISNLDKRAGLNKREISRETMKSIRSELDEVMIGQHKYKDTLLNIVRKQLCGESSSPILVIGHTGCGKDFAIKSLENILLNNNLKLPIINYPISSLTQEGYSGESVADIIKAYKLKKVEIGFKDNDNEGIIVLGEFDKRIIPSYASGGSENVNYGIQGEILRFIEGGMKIQGVDTSKITFILSGAFEGLESILNRKKDNIIGFGNHICEDNNILMKYQDALSEYGMRDELLGRISQIVILDDYTKNDYKNILLNANGKLNTLTKTLNNDGIKVVIESEAVDAIVESVYEERLGARNVENKIKEILTDSLCYRAFMGEYNQIVITANSIKGGEATLLRR